MRIDLCICTFRRPGVSETLSSVDRADIPGNVDLRIIVIDNDHAPTGQKRVEGTARTMRIPVTYLHAPAANISIARNAGLDAADADWIAFLDDDETVPRNWLTTLLERQAQAGADAVFGHSHAVYPDNAPDWIVRRNYHSQIQAPRGGKVLTGHTCNALLRWGNAPWRQQRFVIERGRSGGEDTEFFFRLNRMGARFAIADESVVHETVPDSRLSFAWLRRRRFRIGQSYASSASGAGERLGLLFSALAKATYCSLMALLTLPDRDRRNFWALRGCMHFGVCAGCLALPQQRLYGS